MFIGDLPPRDPARAALRAAYKADEEACVTALIAEAILPADARQRIAATTRRLVETARKDREALDGLDAFLHEYSLATEEGVVLMCLAEALLRIPDAETADRLIRDKLASAEFTRHLGHSHSLLVNASTWGLMLTGQVVALEEGTRDVTGFLGRLVAKAGEPVIRAAMLQAMRIIGRQFVMGRTIDEAMERAAEPDNRVYRYSFDMLGEAALTARDAERYFASYSHAIARIGAAGRDGLGISVKLSALHPRYEFAQRRRLLDELVPRAKALARAAQNAKIDLTIDAEEAARLEPSLDVIEAVLAEHPLGLAVQAYQKRAPHVIGWAADTAQRLGRRIHVRLVKGAYWDTEIKRAQEAALDDYPVFTRKSSTDVSYIACARRLFAAGDAIFPQFATHNAHTVATVLELAQGRPFEFQRLHGMGEALYKQIVPDVAPCRVYAPVGSHEDLLPYLVRRLLENGANTSFVNRWIDDSVPIEAVIADPVERIAALPQKRHPRIPRPRAIGENGRLLGRGVDLTDPLELHALAEQMPEPDLGRPPHADAAAVDRALTTGQAAAPDWDAAGGAARAAMLEQAGALFERDMPRLMALAVREGGKTLPDAVAEVRETVDYCRYYAGRARAEFAEPMTLPGPAGEANQLELHGRGVFGCISPWNFPIAIFAGQVTAALASGNTVLAKPAEQTPLCADAAVRILHEAGVPRDVLHFVPGSGRTVGATLTKDARVGGIVLTGSTETARAINEVLARRAGPIIPFIAETGGQNAMVVDSSALAEQVVGDVIMSAFRSAGQRCSALRVLFLQNEVADRIIEMLVGAMAELKVGDPALLSTDVGPVIDEEARATLQAHADRMTREGKLLYRVALGSDLPRGAFFAPSAFEVDRLGRLEREVFGPILHVIRYSADRLDDVLAAIRATGYGLTLGIHSRIDETVRRIHQGTRIGNTYVNRSTIGAMVGMQPFGGEGLSGTGPKAGGPYYLHRFAVERTLSINTTASGGNASLLSLRDE